MKSISQRGFVVAGALLAAAGVALSAYAAHSADAARLQPAATMALLHGVAVAALGADVRTRLGRWALTVLLLGVVVFSGSLLAAHLAAWSTRLAPVGGMLMIFGWLLYALHALRGPR